MVVLSTQLIARSLTLDDPIRESNTQENPMKHVCCVFSILLCVGVVRAENDARPAKTADSKHIGVGATPVDGAEFLINGSRKMLDEKWTYWEGPRFASSLPIKWKIVDDPVDDGSVVMTDDPVAAGGKYGTADIVTKKKYRDFRLHVEFLVMKPGGNSGVYLQNRYEIQVLDGDKTKHGMAAVINVTMYFNGQKVHHNQKIMKVWGGPNSGIDGGNDGGRGITDVPGGLKLQCEGHDVRYRNTWIKEVDLKSDTDF
jgi:hypothetical protein